MKLSIFGKELFSITSDQATVSQSKKKGLISFDDTIRFILGDFQTGRIDRDNAYPNHIWVYVAVSKIAQNISRVKYRLFDQNENELKTGPAFRLFNTVSPTLDQSKLFEGTQIFKQIKGESFWHLIEGATGIIEIEFLTPAKMKEIVVDNQLNGWEFRDRGQVIPLMIDEVIHFRFFNPDNMFRGLNPLISQTSTIRNDDSSRRFNQSVLDNGSYPGSILTTKNNLDDPAYDRILSRWESRHKNPNNTGKIAVLSGGLEYKEIRLTAEETKLIEQRGLNKDEIHAAYQVPTAITGDTKAFNRANMNAIMRQFWSQTLIPELNSMQENLQTNLLDVHFPGVIGIFDTSQIPELQEELTEQTKRAKTLFDMGVPFADINERLKLGIKVDDKPWLFQGFLPGALIPQDGTSQQPTTTGIVDGFKKFLINVKAIEKTPSDKVQKWHKLINQIIPIERKYANELSKWILGVRREILNNFFGVIRSAIEPLRKIKDKKVIAQKITELEAEQPLFNENDQLATLILISTPFIDDAVKVGGQIAFDEIAFDQVFDLVSENTVKALELRRLKLKEIPDTLKTGVRTILVDGVAGGLSNNQIADDLRFLLNQYKNRSKIVSRTEINGAANNGKILGFGEAGLDEKEWLTSQDDRVRDTHAAINGQVRKIDERFSNGLLYPGDKDGPASEVVNDRCILLGVV